MEPVPPVPSLLQWLELLLAILSAYTGIVAALRNQVLGLDKESTVLLSISSIAFAEILSGIFVLTTSLIPLVYGFIIVTGSFGLVFLWWFVRTDNPFRPNPLLYAIPFVILLSLTLFAVAWVFVEVFKFIGTI